MSYQLNELGNAERFESEFTTTFVWTSSTDWMLYQGGRWVRDYTKGAYRAMIDIGRSIGGTKEEDAWSFMCGSNKVINNSVSIASKMPGVAKNIAVFDRHPELFNCKNGTLNLETGEFHAHDPKDYLTKGSRIVYDPAAKCPQFENFISGIMAGKDSLRLFLQRALGYTMSAYTSETAMFIPYGTGGTGKSQLLIVMKGILGDYGSIADADMFVARHGDAGQPFDMAGREGTRALFSSETREGKRLDQAKVKLMTGGDPVRACYKGKEAYHFTPQWKIWLATNDKPVVSAGDEAIWDRLKLIPFDVKFRNQPGQVKDIGDKLLREESSGILNWFLEGYRMWKSEGLNYPHEITDAVAEWRDSEDYLQRFLDEFTEPVVVRPLYKVLDESRFVKRSDLFKKFTDWAKDSKEGRWMTDKQFVEQMERKGYVSKQVRREGKSDRCWVGLSLNDPLSRFTQREAERAAEMTNFDEDKWSIN